MLIGAVILMVLGIVCMTGIGTIAQLLSEGGYLACYGVVALVTGIFGFKGANGCKGMLTTALVLVLISFVYQLYTLIVRIISTVGLISAAFSLMFLVAGFSVRSALMAKQESAE